MPTPLLPITYLFGDNRSYLYKGKNKNELTPEERQLEALYDRLDRPNNRLTDTQFFQTPEAAQLLDRMHGALADRVPPGSQIVQQTPSKITYRDADGYEHTVTRKPDGTVTTLTNRPAVLPNQRQNEMLDFLQGRVRQGFAGPPTLANLDPDTARALAAISQAEQAANQQTLNDRQGQLIAGLYGNRVNQSSIANNAAARFAQMAGLVGQQQQSDAANRELSIRNLLTTLGQQQNEQATGLYANLSGQGTQRDIAGAGLDVELKRLMEGARQFDAASYIEKLRTQIEQEKLNAYNSPINQIGRLVGLGTQLAGAASGGLSAYRALTRG